jgi:hypothetical protein
VGVDVAMVGVVGVDFTVGVRIDGFGGDEIEGREVILRK